MKLKVELENFIEAIRNEDPYDAYTAQPDMASSLVQVDLDKEVLAIFKSLQHRFEITPNVVLQADVDWNEKAELAIESTDTVDGLEQALARDPKTLDAFTRLMDRVKFDVAHGAPDMFCHFYFNGDFGNMRVYINVKAENAGAVMVHLLEKLHRQGHAVDEVITGFKFPYVRSRAFKRRDVLVVWSDSKHLNDLVAALYEVQDAMGNAFLEGPPLTTGTLDDLKGVGFAPDLEDDDYSYGSWLQRQADECGQDRNKWASAIGALYRRAGVNVDLDFY